MSRKTTMYVKGNNGGSRISCLILLLNTIMAIPVGRRNVENQLQGEEIFIGFLWISMLFTLDTIP